MYRWLFRIVAVALVLASNGAVAARNYTVDDLLRAEGFGAAHFDPQERWLVFERLEPYLDMSRFDMLPRANVLRSRLYRVDLRAAWRAVPLLPDAPPGAISYGFSTDGSRLAIGRLSGQRWQLGVVTMTTGAVRWFDLSPEYTPFYTTLRWVSSERLVAIASADGERPWWLRSDGYAADVLPERWEATRTGRAAAVTIIGSGRFQANSPLPAPRKLVAVDTTSGDVAILATGRFLSFELSPDLKHIALTERGDIPALPQDRPASQVDLPYRQIPSVYDLQHRRMWRPCAECDMLGKPVWSPDGKKVALFARTSGRDWPDADLVELDVDREIRTASRPTGIETVIEEHPDGTARAAFHWRGSELLLFARRVGASDGRRDWYVVHGSRAVPLTSQLPQPSGELLAVEGCNVATSTSDGFWCLDANAPHPIPAPAIRSGELPVDWQPLPGGISLSATLLEGSKSTISADARIERVDASSRGDILLVRQLAGDGARTLSLVTREQAGTIATVNRHLRDVEPASPQPLTYRLSDGREAMAWLYHPPGLPASHRPPLVIIPYPGRTYGPEAPAGQGVGADRFYTSAQILAGRGYAVLLPSLPRRDAAAGAKAPSFVADVDRAADAAIVTGTVDGRRIALWGHSYGGYAVAMIAAESCRYSTAIASAGVYDLAATAGTLGPVTRLAPEQNLPIGHNFAWAETGQGGLGALPWQDPTRYISASPVYRAGRIRTPMLIIAADLDPAPLQGAEQLFSALFRQGKDAELVTYWGEGHVVGSPANLRDLYERVFSWLDRTISRTRSDCDPLGVV